MAREDSPSRNALPKVLDRPQISLLGPINPAMVEKLIAGLNDAPEDQDLAVEISTPGGDAELGRRMVLEVELARRRRSGRTLFLGKTEVYSAGATLMSAFPREDRYATPDTSFLIHCRQLDSTIEISGPIRASIPKVEALSAQLRKGIEQEEENFRKLVAGSNVTLEETYEKALYNWYLTADEALERGLIAAIYD
jgi:ATP-dependent protease ClpP protease subunit